MNQDLQNLEIKVENEGSTPQGRLTAAEWNILVAAVKSLDLTGGSVDIASILQAVADAGYATQEWVNNQNYATTTDFNKFVKDFVTLDTTQAISGIKDFTNGLKVGGLLVYKSQADTIYFDCNIVARGDITAFGTNKTITASIFEALPIDGATLKRTENGVLYVDTTVVGSGGGTGGGISIADVENYLTTNGYATQSWVTGKGYISGITDAMVTDALGYTPLDKQGVAFDSNKFGGLSVTDFARVKQNISDFDANNMPDGVWGGKLFGSPNWALDYYAYLSVGSGNYKMQFNGVNNRLTYRAGNESGIENKDWVEILSSANYSNYALPITGGTITGEVTITAAANSPLKINSTATDLGIYFNLNGTAKTWIGYESTKGSVLYHSAGSHRLGINNAGVAFFDSNTLLHSGNYSEYALPITGGTVNGKVDVIYKYGSATAGEDMMRVGCYASNPYGLSLGTASASMSYIQSKIFDNSLYTLLSLNPFGGNVAVGGTTATEKLHLYGNMLFDGERVVKSSLIGEVLYMGGSYLVFGGGTTAKGISTYIDGKTVYVRAGNYAATFSDTGGLTWNGNILATGGLNANFVTLSGKTALQNYQNAAIIFGTAATGSYVDGSVVYIRSGATLAGYAKFEDGNILTTGALSLGLNNRTRIIENPFAASGMTLADSNNKPLVTVSYFSDHAYVYNYKNSKENSGISFYDDGRVVAAQNFICTGGITAQNSSDRRLKKNIRKFNPRKVLMSLGAVWEYEYIDSEVQKNHIYAGTHYGLIYQHVKGTKLDVMCHEREDGFGTLNYLHPKFISLIAGATMENISEVEKLKRKIRHLETKVKQLEKRA